MFNKWLVDNRIIRRVLVFGLTYLFIRVTLNLFSDLSSITTQGVAAYGILMGLEREILRFFLQGTQEEADND
ncbi:unnamed protein product [marine sediment metagenome]|uniref:Uncharacterized protein n=1 Tax=marine sediment metagenome TaxID=412755 RepID=X1IZW0_9ZZZZ